MPTDFQGGRATFRFIRQHSLPHGCGPGRAVEAGSTWHGLTQ